MDDQKGDPLVTAMRYGVAGDRNTNSFATPPAHAVCCQSMCAVTKPCYNSVMSPGRILVHISRREHRVLDPEDVYYLQASGGETEIRLRARQPLVDVRPIGDVMVAFDKHGFVRIHREHAVNPAYVRLLRLQADGRDWEVKMEPPVNRVLPIARDRLSELRSALGGPSG